MSDPKQPPETKKKLINDYMEYEAKQALPEDIILETIHFVGTRWIPDTNTKKAWNGITIQYSVLLMILQHLLTFMKVVMADEFLIEIVEGFFNHLNGLQFKNIDKIFINNSHSFIRFFGSDITVWQNESEMIQLLKCFDKTKDPRAAVMLYEYHQPDIFGESNKYDVDPWDCFHYEH